MSFLGDIIPYFQSPRHQDSEGDSNEPDIGDQEPMKDSPDTAHGQYTSYDEDKEDDTSDNLGLPYDDHDQVYQDYLLYDNPFDLHEYDEPQEMGEMSRIKRLGLAEDAAYENTRR